MWPGWACGQAAIHPPFAHQCMRAELDVGQRVDRIAWPVDPAAFLRGYVSRNKPCIITGAAPSVGTQFGCHEPIAHASHAINSPHCPAHHSGVASGTDLDAWAHSRTTPCRSCATSTGAGSRLCCGCRPLQVCSCLPAALHFRQTHRRCSGSRGCKVDQCTGGAHPSSRHLLPVPALPACSVRHAPMQGHLATGLPSIGVKRRW